MEDDKKTPDRFIDEEKVAYLLSNFTSEEMLQALKEKFDNYIYYFKNSPSRLTSEDYVYELFEYGGYCPQTQYGMFKDVEEEFKYNHVPYEEYEYEDEEDY